MSPFVHLNVHSEYSAMASVPSLESLCRAARERGFETLALTDTNGLYGAVRFVEIAKQNGIRPIIGCELRHKQSRAVLLVKREEGYANLCRIVSARHEDKDFDLARTVARFRDGLIVISDSAEALRRWKDQSSEDLYIEMTPGVNMEKAYALSRRQRIRAVATNAVHFVDPEEISIYRLLRAIRLNTTLSRLPDCSAVLPQHWLAPGDFVERYFPHLPEAVANTRRIAEACNTGLGLKKQIFPTFSGLTDSEAFTKLRRKTYAGAARRYVEISAEVRRRIEEELRIIQEKNYAHYFLVVEEITVRAAITCGRGSGAASIVAYCLGITDVDPIRHGLFFERFLNANREDPPDIDIDFPWDERDSVIQAVFARYGQGRVAMVANHNRLGMPGAIREVAKVYGIPTTEITRIAARIIKQEEIFRISENPSCQIWAESLCRNMQLGAPWPEILNLAWKVEGHFRNLSVHCGGLVIVPDEIRKYVPVETAAGGVPVLQWDKEQVEEAGLIKIDLLGNRSLSVIREALSAVEKNYGKALDRANWDPFSDESTKQLIRTATTIGCFNIESPALRLLLKKLWSKMPAERTLFADVFDYLVMVSSLVRPAAISFVSEFIRRAHGADSPRLHPALEPILRRTHGIMLYQEDVTRVATAWAGFTAEQADQLRKALNKRRKAKELKEYRGDFYRGARGRGVSPATIEAVWTMILSFAGYSFCKAHSASYAQISFKCAYLKAHYPAEFMAAVLSNEGGYYPSFAYVSECRRMGFELKAPCINESQWCYHGQGRTICAGFMIIRGIKKSFIRQLIEERNARGLFQSFHDFCLRTEPELAQLRLLIKTGCFDSIAGSLSRPGMLWRAYAYAKGENSGRLPNPKEYSDYEELTHEIDCFGFLLSRHPLELYRIERNCPSLIEAAEMHRYIGKRVKVLGWLITEKLTQTKKGEPMEFVTFEDTSAIYEATFFTDAYRRLWHMLAPNHPFLIDGIVEEDFGAVTLNVKELNRLDLNQKSCYAHLCGNAEENSKIGSRIFAGKVNAEESA
jgi:error-prone DNA polymerase